MGMVGEMVSQGLKGHEVIKADVNRVDEWHNDEVFLDVTDAGSVRDAVDECDVVIHLVVHNVIGRPNEDLSYAKGAVETDIPGITNVLLAAARHPKKHVIYASSVSGFDGYPTSHIRRVQDPPLADSIYGLTKVFGEAACLNAFYTRGVPVSIMRLGRPARKVDLHGNGLFGKSLPFFVHPMDVERSFAWAVDHPPETAGSGRKTRALIETSFSPNIYHVVGDNIGLQFDLGETWKRHHWRPLFGYHEGREHLQVFDDEHWDLFDLIDWGDEIEAVRKISSSSDEVLKHPQVIQRAARRGNPNIINPIVARCPDWSRSAIIWAAASDHDTAALDLYSLRNI